MSIAFVLVLALRLLVPLLIPRFPVPALVASLVIDAVDQTVFQTFGGLPDDYQGYDKALDVYYLVIAYAATLRNWTDPVAFGVGRFLWYYRLVGVVAFELTGARPLLLIFPNTFEYFVIAYELVRTRWDPERIPARAVVGTAAVIWVVVKLPQEWWIHVAELDVTDQMAAHGWILPSVVTAVVVALAVLAGCWSRLPARDWPLTFDVDRHRPAWEVAPPSPAAIRTLPFWSSVAEKVLLISLVSVIFAQVLQVRSTNLQVVLGTAVIVLVNATISAWFARHGTSWTTTARQFLAMLVVNVGAVVAFTLLRGRITADAEPDNAFFLLLLLSLIVTLYDRYRTLRERRIVIDAVIDHEDGREPARLPAAPA